MDRPIRVWGLGGGDEVEGSEGGGGQAVGRQAVGMRMDEEQVYVHDQRG